MNYQPQGLFHGMSQEDIMRIYQMIQQRQNQPMLTGPMMLAQANPNQLQQMIGVRGDGVSSQTKAGIEAAIPGFYGTKQPAPPPGGYSLGNDAPGQKSLEQRQRNRSAAKLDLPPGKDYTDDEILAATLRKRLAPR